MLAAPPPPPPAPPIIFVILIAQLRKVTIDQLQFNTDSLMAKCITSEFLWYHKLTTELYGDIQQLKALVCKSTWIFTYNLQFK